MNTPPKVSIIIPFVKDRGYLSEAILSAKTQTYQGEIEIIMSQSSGSVSYNLNQGIKKATGDYIKYLCDDDKLPNNCIEESVKTMQGMDFIHGMAINFFPSGEKELYYPPETNPTLERMLFKNIIHGGTLMYRKDVFDRFGYFDESLNCAEEYDMNLRLLKNGAKLGYSREILYYYRRHHLQKSLGVAVDQIARAKRIQAIQDKNR